MIEEGFITEIITPECHSAIIIKQKKKSFDRGSTVYSGSSQEGGVYKRVEEMVEWSGKTFQRGYNHRLKDDWVLTRLMGFSVLGRRKF